MRNRSTGHFLSWISVVLSVGTLATTAADAPRSTALDSPPPAPDGYAWKIIRELTDEFTGTTLDDKKWLPKHPDWKGREPSVYDPSNVSVKDGMLHLCNTTRVKTLDAVKNPEKDVWVQSACVSSSGRIASYGYYAARMKASRICMTSSFWFQDEHTEIDVVEQFGLSVKNTEEKMLMLMNTHFFPQGWDTDKATPQRWQMPTASGDTFHVYGVHSS